MLLIPFYLELKTTDLVAGKFPFSFVNDVIR